MSKSKLVSDLELRFAREMVSLCQEMQQLEAQYHRLIGDYLMPGKELPDRIGHMTSVHITANLERLREGSAAARMVHEEIAKKLFKRNGVKP